MAIKILLDPGHYAGYNKVSCGYSEGTRMWTLYTYLAYALKQYGFTVGVTKNSAASYPKTSSGEDDITARGRKAAGYNLMLSLHTNACSTASVNRPEVIYPINGNGRILAVNIAYALQKLMGLQTYKVFSKKNSSGTADYYGVIRGASSVGTTCLIIEHTFHTNPTMAKWMMSDANIKKMAECVAATVASYYGYTKKEDEIDMTEKELRALIKEVVGDILKGEDTTVSGWVTDEMATAKAKGISDGSRPGGYATRQEVVAMIVRALDVK